MAQKEVSGALAIVFEYKLTVEQNQPPLNTTPPFSRLSPSNKPALNRQRDHSACGRQDTPLRVRKTRENLRPQSIYVDIPPPCLHGRHCRQDDSLTYIATASSAASVRDSVELDKLDDGVSRADGQMNKTPQVDQKASSQQAQERQQQQGPPPSTTSRIQRQRSISRRVLSKVKQGITNRSRSSIRPVDSDINLARRPSGKRKQSIDVERRAQSFDLSSDSVASDIDVVQESVDSSPTAAQRSATGSTVSTAELFNDLVTIQKRTILTEERHLQHTSGPCTLSPSLSSSPSPQPTPRPPPKQSHSRARQPGQSVSLQLPCVGLKVAMDCTTVDASLSRYVWVAIEAEVQTKTISFRSDVESGSIGPTSTSKPEQPVLNLASNTDNHHQQSAQAGYDCGTVTSLRLCYKAVGNSRICDVMGQKTVKDIAIGQKCILFLRVQVPKIMLGDDTTDQGPDVLFTELESIVGTLETDVLHVEARYRLSILPADNVVTVRHVCKLRRPKTESRWSLALASNEVEATANVRLRLVEDLASQHPPGTALQLIRQYLDTEMLEQTAVQAICSSLEVIGLQPEHLAEDSNPSVVVTDIDSAAAMRSSMPFSEPAPISPNQLSTTVGGPSVLSTKPLSHKPSTPSLHPLASTTPLRTNPTPSKPPNPFTPPPTSHLHPETRDTARELWHHLRRSSLTAKQLEEMSPERVQLLEASDEVLRVLRRKALANKRSVGAETLRAWKWDGGEERGRAGEEAPWM